MGTRRTFIRSVIGLAISFTSAASLGAPPIERHWKVAGEDRVALLFVPEGKAEGKRPVVFAFHGHGGNMRQAANRFGFQREWPEAIVVYMQGLPTPGALTDPQGLRNGWQKTVGDQHDRDLQFFDALLTTLKKEYPVDDKRVFATGHSNGGAFTYLLWAERCDQFAAVAPVAAVAGRNAAKLKPKPAMHVAGRTDPLVRFTWQERCMEDVRKLNGCSEKGKEWAKSGTVEATIYESKAGTPFISVIHPGGHMYPTGATALIVRFFKDTSAGPPRTSPPSGR